MSFKILSDFDGVWTDPYHEAQSVRRLMEVETARCSGGRLAQVATDFDAFLALALARPEVHGWAPLAFTAGRVTAFVDEDPFCAGNALAGVLGEVADGKHREVATDLTERAQIYANGIRSKAFGTGFTEISDFADQAFLKATATYQENHEHALVDGAAEIAAAILDAGCELVLVSNSSPNKLLSWFGAVGIACHVAGETSKNPRSVVVRGSAGKFILGPGNQSLEAAGRQVFLDRPKYRSVLEVESPDLVIGDVFSLDLALPAAMRAAGESAAPSSLVLRRHDYSPTWSAEDRADGRIDHVIDQLDELPELAKRLAALAR